ncbi:MAG: MFS transporter [Planctomycetaceae bacterium]|jgi:MFS transporter, PAT family, beta-lactamase induction signal transducer AmpG|nr:MFS transporter [Planctomycetaceae bacterium]
MALADSRTQRVCALCILYFAQGVPYGFMTITMANYLSGMGLSTQRVGELTAFALLPWTFKVIWAPIIDSLQFRGYGRRRPWIVMAQMLMALTLVGIYFAEPYMVGEEIDIERSADLLLWVFFVHNVFAVLQDVVSDALAVDLLSENEQGAVNGAMWASKLLGMALGAGVLATIMDQYGIQGAVAAQIIVLLLIMLVPLLLVERQGDKRFPWDVYGSSKLEPSRQMRHRSIGEILHDVLRGFSMRTTMFFFVIVLLSLIGWGVMETILKTICNQQIGWSSTHTSVVMGYSYVPEAISAVLFGFLGDRFGRKKMMILGMGGYGLVSILFALGSDYWGNSYPTDWAADGYWDNHIVWLYVVGYKVLLAIFVVNYLAESMALSWTSSSATMFTIFMTLSNVGHVLGNLMAGDVERIFGAAHSFIAMGIFNIVILSLLIYVRREDVTERISEEEAIFSG